MRHVLTLLMCVDWLSQPRCGGFPRSIYHMISRALARRSNQSEQTEAFKGGAARFTFPLTSTAVLSEILLSKQFNVCFASSGVLPK